MMFTIVGGTDHVPESHGKQLRGQALMRAVDARLLAEQSKTLSGTARNRRLRQERYRVWAKADAARGYWRARLDLESAIGIGQRNEVPEALQYHPQTPEGRWTLLNNYRAAEAKQLLTPAPNIAAVNWKRAVLAKGGLHLLLLNEAQLEKAIADDLAFLSRAHPTRRPRGRNA